MKKILITSFVSMLLCASLGYAQGRELSGPVTDNVVPSIKPEPVMAQFANGEVVFQYPATWTLTDKSTAENQHLELSLQGTSAQIIVLVERKPLTRPDKLESVLRAKITAFANIMTKELAKAGSSTQRSTVTTDVGGVRVEGLRLRAAPGNETGQVEVYAFMRGGRIVMLTLLRPDAEAKAAEPAWNAVSSSLSVGGKRL